MKRKLFKILFILSFIPYIILFVMAILDGFYGTAEYGSAITYGLAKPWIGESQVNMIYGIEAFKQTIMFNFIGFTFVYPIIPILLFYQLIYLVIMIKNRK